MAVNMLRVLGYAVFLVAIVFVPAAFAGPITTNTALPVHEGELIVRGQGKFLQSTGDGTAMNRNLTVWAAPTVFVYGANEKLALFGIVPYLDKRLSLNTTGGRRTRGDAGLGDLSFLARYTVGQWDRPQETLRLAPFVGIEVPSGKDDTKDSLGRLPQPLQLGSGSWDPIVGTIFTWQKLAWEFDASASYKRNTAANNFEIGDVTRLDLSFQYRLSPFSLPGGGVPAFLYAVLESNVLQQAKNRAAGVDDPNSGGTSWFLAPGLQYVTRRWILETAVQLPVAQDLNGNALENDLIVTSGFRVIF